MNLESVSRFYPRWSYASCLTCDFSIEAAAALRRDMSDRAAVFITDSYHFIDGFRPSVSLFCLAVILQFPKKYLKH
jgi:hypothetical protein